MASNAGGDSSPSETPSLEITNDGTCGGSITCQGSNWGRCCSEHGFCGNSYAYCGPGCKSGFGVCSGDAEARISSNACPAPFDVVRSTSILTWTNYFSTTTTITDVQVITTARIVAITSTMVVSKFLTTETTTRVETKTTTVTSTIYRHSTKIPTTTVFVYRQPGTTEIPAATSEPTATPTAPGNPGPTLPGTSKNCTSPVGDACSKPLY